MTLRFVLPKRHHVVVAGKAPDEGNAAEVVRALAARYDGDIWWIAPPSVAVMESLGVADNPRIHRVEERWRVPVLAAYVTAELVVTTHGLFGMPATTHRKPVLDLWHAEQTKGGGRLYPFRHLPGRPSSFLLIASDRLAEAKLSRAGLTRKQMLWAPNPRVDQLARPASDAMLNAVGVDPAKPFVVWMPTFRQGKQSVRDAAWINTADTGLDERLSDLLGTLLVPAFAAAGIQLVVKPHPMDLVARNVDNAIVVLSDGLNDAGVPLYSLLGRSAGLITDYSSVWIDYLSIDRPIAFYMPDKGAFEVGRGDFPDGVYDQPPGPILLTQDDVDSFIADIRAGGALGAKERSATIQHLGLKVGPGAADSVLDYARSHSALKLSLLS